MLVFAYFAINAIMVAVIAVAVQRAPEGYEDDLGFHFIRRPLPGCGGMSGLLG